MNFIILKEEEEIRMSRIWWRLDINTCLNVELGLFWMNFECVVLEAA